MRRGLWFIVLVGVLAACAPNSGAGDPTATVEGYLNAKITSDRDALASYLCAELEGTLDDEARTFATVTEATLQDAACTFDVDTSTVTCTGEIVAAYGMQETAFPLTTYRVVQEAGEWKWCGEA